MIFISFCRSDFHTDRVPCCYTRYVSLDKHYKCTGGNIVRQSGGNLRRSTRRVSELFYPIKACVQEYSESNGAHKFVMFLSNLCDEYRGLRTQFSEVMPSTDTCSPQPRPQSSPASFVVTSPVKLVGENSPARFQVSSSHSLTRIAGIGLGTRLCSPD